MAKLRCPKCGAFLSMRNQVAKYSSTALFLKCQKCWILLSI